MNGVTTEGLPARSAAPVVPAPPWWTIAAMRGKSQSCGASSRHERCRRAFVAEPAPAGAELARTPVLRARRRPPRMSPRVQERHRAEPDIDGRPAPRRESAQAPAAASSPRRRREPEAGRPDIRRPFAAAGQQLGAIGRAAAARRVRPPAAARRVSGRRQAKVRIAPSCCPGRIREPEDPAESVDTPPARPARKAGRRFPLAVKEVGGGDHRRTPALHSRTPKPLREHARRTCP